MPPRRRSESRRKSLARNLLYTTDAAVAATPGGRIGKEFRRNGTSTSPYIGLSHYSAVLWRFVGLRSTVTFVPASTALEVLIALKSLCPSAATTIAPTAAAVSQNVVASPYIFIPPELFRAHGFAPDSPVSPIDALAVTFPSAPIGSLLSALAIAEACRRTPHAGSLLPAVRPLLTCLGTVLPAANSEETFFSLTDFTCVRSLCPDPSALPAAVGALLRADVVAVSGGVEAFGGYDVAAEVLTPVTAARVLLSHGDGAVPRSQAVSPGAPSPLSPHVVVNWDTVALDRRTFQVIGLRFHELANGRPELRVTDLYTGAHGDPGGVFCQGFLLPESLFAQYVSAVKPGISLSELLLDMYPFMPPRLISYYALPHTHLVPAVLDALRASFLEASDGTHLDAVGLAMAPPSNHLKFFIEGDNAWAQKTVDFEIFNSWCRTNNTSQCPMVTFDEVLRGLFLSFPDWVFDSLAKKYKSTLSRPTTAASATLTASASRHSMQSSETPATEPEETGEEEAIALQVDPNVDQLAVADALLGASAASPSTTNSASAQREAILAASIARATTTSVPTSIYASLKETKDVPCSSMDKMTNTLLVPCFDENFPRSGSVFCDPLDNSSGSREARLRRYAVLWPGIVDSARNENIARPSEASEQPMSDSGVELSPLPSAVALCLANLFPHVLPWSYLKKVFAATTSGSVSTHLLLNTTAVQPWSLLTSFGIEALSQRLKEAADPAAFLAPQAEFDGYPLHANAILRNIRLRKAVSEAPGTVDLSSGAPDTEQLLVSDLICGLCPGISNETLELLTEPASPSDSAMIACRNRYHDLRGSRGDDVVVSLLDVVTCDDSIQDLVRDLRLIVGGFQDVQHRDVIFWTFLWCAQTVAERLHGIVDRMASNMCFCETMPFAAFATLLLPHLPAVDVVERVAVLPEIAAPTVSEAHHLMLRLLSDFTFEEAKERDKLYYEEHVCWEALLEQNLVLQDEAAALSAARNSLPLIRQTCSICHMHLPSVAAKNTHELECKSNFLREMKSQSQEISAKQSRDTLKAAISARTSALKVDSAVLPIALSGTMASHLYTEARRIERSKAAIESARAKGSTLPYITDGAALTRALRINGLVCSSDGTLCSRMSAMQRFLDRPVAQQDERHAAIPGSSSSAAG